MVVALALIPSMTPAAAAHLALAAPDARDPLAPPDLYARELAAGRLHLLGVTRGGAHVATLAVRLDECEGGRELVLVACGGAAPGADLTAELAAAVEPIARSCRARALRLHTRRPGLVRKAKRHGWHVAETVLRKALA